VEYNTGTENAKIKGHYTRLDFGFDSYSSFFSPASAIWHRKPIITTIQKYLFLFVSVWLGFVSVFGNASVCVHWDTCSRSLTRDKTGQMPYPPSSHIFSKHHIPHTTQHNTHSQQITHAQKSPFVIVCCYCCRRVFFHIQFHCMTYAFLLLMCLRSICINACSFLFPHVTCMRAGALG